MNLVLKKSRLRSTSKLVLTGSKSESNRLLLLHALYPQVTFQNASNSDDTAVMQKALSENKKLIDVHHAGTAMRFLTAFFAIQSGKEVVLLGSERMHERPIKILVDALRSMGCDIQYVKNEGYPPLKIVGKSINPQKVQIDAGVSSQYISALLLIAASLPDGLQIELMGKCTSQPYVEMTLQLLNQVGISTQWKENTIHVFPPKEVHSTVVTVESDWSSASYFFSLLALSPVKSEITLSFFAEKSLQGDAVLVKIYEEFGVQTRFNTNQSITLTKVKDVTVEKLSFDLQHAPDIAQTIAVTAFALGIELSLKGLHTLKIKETDRLQALKSELEKCGACVDISSHTLKVHRGSVKKEEMPKIKTYQDHRMAMAFAPLALKRDLMIENAEVVSKSYPEFWSDIQQIGIQIERVY